MLLLRRTNFLVVALTVVLTGALTVFYIRSASDAPFSPLDLDELADNDAPAIVPPHSGGSPALGETDPEFGILPIDLGSPVEHDMLEEDGIAFIPDRPSDVEVTPPASASTTTTTKVVADEKPTEIVIPPPALSDSKTPSKLPSKAFPYTFKSPLLASRLEAFLARPILSVKDALKDNNKACPPKIHDKQVNSDQLRGEREFWNALKGEDIKSRREGLVKGLEEAEHRGEKIVGDLKAKIERRGIVVAGGNRDTTARIFALLRILRNHHKSKLPVEIHHFPGEITDGNERKELETLGATFRQFEGVPQLNIWKNFQIKALSILNSAFDEVLYLDSDNIVLQDPEPLFEDPGYLKHGKAVFWPDINKDHPENAIFRILGETCNHYEWQIDSGQILIDKRGNDGLNLAALHLAALMQVDHEFWFKMSGGDKDTFRYAFHMLDISFFASPRWLSSAGSLNPLDGNRFCGNTMLQYDLTSTPRPLFLHANLLKHAAGVREGSTFTHIKTVPHSAAHDPSLDGARMWVYNGPGRGMCVDLEMDGGQEGTTLLEWEEGGGLKGLEALFYREGGRAGGW